MRLWRKMNWITWQRDVYSAGRWQLKGDSLIYFCQSVFIFLGQIPSMTLSGPHHPVLIFFVMHLSNEIYYSSPLLPYVDRESLRNENLDLKIIWEITLRSVFLSIYTITSLTELSTSLTCCAMGLINRAHMLIWPLPKPLRPHLLISVAFLVSFLPKSAHRDLSP